MIRVPPYRRVAVLLLMGVVVAAGLYGYRRYAASMRYWWAPPIGEGPAGPRVPLEPFQKPWTDRPVMLLGLGDSITAGFGASPGMSYFERLVQNPDDEFFDMQGRCLPAVLPALEVRNLSVSGSNSIEHLERQVRNLEPAPPDVLGLVVMTTGGNDLIHWYGRTPPQEGAMYGASLEQAQPWIERFAQRLESMMDVISAAFPGGCEIFLANIYDPSDGVGDPAAANLPPWPDVLDILTAYNQVIASCAEKRPNVHLVDLHSAFLGHGVHCLQFWREHYRPEDPHYWYYDNLEDPNDRGYDAIRRLYLLKMVDVLATD